MGRSLYLINPKSEAPSYFGAEVFEHWGYAPAQGIADLALPTVAALAPEGVEITLCDEYIQPIDFDVDVDYVGLTGKVTQAGRMIEVAEEFRRRGKTVILGGPFVSLSPDVLRPHCDVLVRGEMEGIADRFFADLLADRLDEEYQGDRPDLSGSPVPRWDLYPNPRASLGCVQTSRGCPFECEFCDVIQYLGRQQRHKAVEQILAELEELQRYGYRGVLLADDNFTVYRRRAKEVLSALAEWNSRQEQPLFFGTQVSIDAARDDELLDLCARAGLTWVFIGIETPNEESLRESRKRQNVGVDLVSQVQRFLDHGIAVAAGMIVGFDHDGPDIFERQFEFAMSSPIAIFSLGALVAPAATPLYDRMASSGRLVEGGGGNRGHTLGHQHRSRVADPRAALRRAATAVQQSLPPEGVRRPAGACDREPGAPSRSAPGHGSERRPGCEGDPARRARSAPQADPLRAGGAPDVVTDLQDSGEQAGGRDRRDGGDGALRAGPVHVRGGKLLGASVGGGCSGDAGYTGARAREPLGITRHRALTGSPLLFSRFL